MGGYCGLGLSLLDEPIAHADSLNRSRPHAIVEKEPHSLEAQIEHLVKIRSQSSAQGCNVDGHALKVRGLLLYAAGLDANLLVFGQSDDVVAIRRSQLRVCKQCNPPRQ